MQTVTVHHRDCLEGMRALSDGTVDLVFADPPFNIGYEYDQYHDRRPTADYLHWSEHWMREVHRILSPTGSFWLAIGDDFAAELKVLATGTCGFFCRNWVIWHYTFGVHCQRKFTRSHTHLLYFVKDAKQFTFNDTAVRVPSARQSIYRDKRANPAGRIPDDTWILRPQEIPSVYESDQDVWFSARVCGTFRERAGWHGCQMPEQVLGRILLTSSHPGDLVLDPFLGSGTTLVVAKKLGRRGIGFEISADYAEAAKQRLQGVSVGDPLIGDSVLGHPVMGHPVTGESPSKPEKPAKKTVRPRPFPPRPPKKSPPKDTK